MTPLNLTKWSVILLAIFLAIWLGSIAADMSPSSMVEILGILLLVWVVCAGQYWWVMLPPAIAFGGFFYFGYKIYFSEIALVVSLLPVIPVIFLNKFRRPSAPLPMPWITIALTVFLIAQAVYGLSRGLGHPGNAARDYLYALWPLFFYSAYYFYGSKRGLSGMIFLLYTALFARIAIELYSYIFPDLAYLPGLNFFPSQGVNGLRYSASEMFILCVALMLYSLATKRWWRYFFRCLYALLALVSLGVFCFGGGRSQLVSVAVLPLFWLAIYRKMVLALSLVMALIAGLYYLNQNPTLIESLPDSVQRGLSILIFDQNRLEVQRELIASNNWHEDLRNKAFAGLIQSPANFLFGHPIESFEDINDAEIPTANEYFAYRVEVAARCGTYESGLASILGVYGVLGFILYFATFFYCLKEVFPHLFGHGVRNFTEVVYFIAVSQLFIWVVACWASGGIPSTELMWALIAKKLWLDDHPKSKPVSSAEILDAGALA